MTKTGSSSNGIIVVNAIAWLHILSHTALFAVDFTLFTNSLDSLQRNDGTRSDPFNLFPLEIVFGMLVAMNHGTIAVAYIVAMTISAKTTSSRALTMQMASILSAWFHGMFIVHMIWKWDVWNKTFHREGTLSPTLLFGVHCLWFGLALVAIMLTRKGSKEHKEK